MNNKIITLFLVMAVIGTVFVSGCVTGDQSAQSAEEESQETTLLSEIDSEWTEETDNVEIGEMY